MFTNKFDEYSPDIGFNGLAIYWIELNNVTVFFSFCFDCFLLVVDIVALFYIHCFLGIFHSKWMTPEKYL